MGHRMSGVCRSRREALVRDANVQDAARMPWWPKTRPGCDTLYPVKTRRNCRAMARLFLRVVGVFCFASGVALAQVQPVIRFVKNPDPAPALELKDLNGKNISLQEAKGKIVLLNFWATWCGPCRAEIPDLIDLQNKYKDQLEIIALATDEDDSDAVAKFVKKSGINYRVGMATDAIQAEYGGIPALPTSFVIDPQGRVVQKHVGLNDPRIYEMEVRALLDQPVNARVEYFEDKGEVFLSHADRATELPGVDLSKLTDAQKRVALKRFNSENCTCGCALTLAQCRINDTACEVSQGMTSRILEEITGKTSKKQGAAKAAAQRKPQQ